MPLTVPEIAELLRYREATLTFWQVFGLAVARGLADPADAPAYFAAYAEDPRAARRALDPFNTEDTA